MHQNQQWDEEHDGPGSSRVRTYHTCGAEPAWFSRLARIDLGNVAGVDGRSVVPEIDPVLGRRLGRSLERVTCPDSPPCPLREHRTPSGACAQQRSHARRRTRLCALVGSQRGSRSGIFWITQRNQSGDGDRMTAGHNALRGSGPGQKLAFDDAVALVGCPDRRIDRLCITCCSPSQLSHPAG
jgi:hypothetical protein